MSKIRSFSESISTGRPSSGKLSHGQAFKNFYQSVMKVIKAMPTMTEERVRKAVNRARSHEELSKVDEKIMKIFGPADYLPYAGYRKTRLEKD